MDTSRSPVPIYRHGLIPEVSGIYVGEDSNTTVMSRLIPSQCDLNSISCYEKPYIVVSDRLLRHKEDEVILHELGHHRCRMTDCRCLYGGRIALNEMHAIKFSLLESASRGLIETHVMIVKYVLRVLKNPNAFIFIDRRTSKAVHKLIKWRKWQQHLHMFD